MAGTEHVVTMAPRGKLYHLLKENGDMTVEPMCGAAPDPDTWTVRRESAAGNRRRLCTTCEMVAGFRVRGGMSGPLVVDA